MSKPEKAWANVIPAVLSKSLRDGARYRWLRDNGRIMPHDDPGEVDRAVDQEVARQDREPQS